MQRRVFVESHVAAQRAMAAIGSVPDATLRFWAAVYPNYNVRKVALFEMTRRERLETS